LGWSVAHAESARSRTTVGSLETPELVREDGVAAAAWALQVRE
jgi:hypothetical protein